MRVVRVVFEEELKSYGLSEREIREVAGKVVRAISKEKSMDWDLNDVVAENGYCRIAIECNDRLGGKFGNWADSLQIQAERIFKQIQEALEDYAYLKQFIAVYNNCNGHNGNGRKVSEDTKEIMRKLGIVVIS